MPDSPNTAARQPPGCQGAVDAMTRVRSTLSLALTLERANNMLRESHDSQQQARYGVASFMEALLHDANAYAGFQYLTSAGVTNGVDGFDAVDESRRVYMLHGSIPR